MVVLEVKATLNVKVRPLPNISSRLPAPPTQGAAAVAEEDILKVLTSAPVVSVKNELSFGFKAWIKQEKRRATNILGSTFSLI